MKRFSVALVLLTLIAITVTGCAPKGSVEFSMDLSPLLESEAMTRASITRVTITLTRTGHSTVIKELSVSNNVATGRVDNLAAGYWHVAVAVFDGTTELFTGERDIEVTAGFVQQYTILVDPGTDPPTTGSISFSVGLNPLPGYKPLYQLANALAMDSAGAKLYILDATTNKIGVYDANTMNRERDLPVTQVPTVLRLNWDNTALLMGYPTGKIFSMNVSTGVTTQIADLGMVIKQFLPFGGKYILVANDLTYPCTLKVWDTDTGTIVKTATMTYYGVGTAFELNPVNNTAYFRSSNGDLCRARLNNTNGDVTVSYGNTASGVVRVILNGTRLATGNGAMYTCSELDSQDSVSTGNLGSAFVDLVNDDAGSSIYFITQSPYKLCAMSHSDLIIKTFADLKGTPKYLFQTGDTLVLIAEDAGKVYAKTWAKSEFGL